MRSAGMRDAGSGRGSIGIPRPGGLTSPQNPDLAQRATGTHRYQPPAEPATARSHSDRDRAVQQGLTCSIIGQALARHPPSKGSVLSAVATGLRASLRPFAEQTLGPAQCRRAAAVGGARSGGFVTELTDS